MTAPFAALGDDDVDAAVRRLSRLFDRVNLLRDLGAGCVGPLDASKVAESEVTKVAKKPAPKVEEEAEKPAEPEKKLSRWDRFKRWWKEGPKEKKD